MPPHPAVVAPGADVPASVAALAGAWEGTWSDGEDSVLVVFRLGPSAARVLLANGRYSAGRRPPWHGWAKARVSSDPAPTLRWKSGPYAVSFALGPDGRLRGIDESPRERLEVVMRRRAVEILAVAPDEHAFVCPSFQPLLSSIEGAADPSERRARVDAVVAGARASGGPLTGPGTRPGVGCATFLWQGEAEEVALAGDMNGWSTAKDDLARVPGTDLFHASFELPDDARLDYKLLPDGKWSLDLLNPRTILGGYGPNSELRMPGYRPPPEVVRDPAVPAGTLETLVLRSSHLGNSRKARVYLPPGYAGGSDRYPVLYLHDGQDTLDFGAMDTVLDNLIAAKAIPPILAVMVPPVRREEEYRMSPAFEAFFVQEVVPAVDARYRTRASPAGRAVGGISMGGTAALSLALGHPDVFGACIAQSSSPGDQLVALLDLARGRRRPAVSVWLDVGIFESDLHGWDLLDQSRRLRDDLAARGFRLRFLEVNEGHSWGSWRARMREAIAFIWGGAGP